MAQVSPIQLQKYLGGIDYPCSKNELIDHAKDSGAAEDIVHALKNLQGSRFDSPSEVSKAFGRAYG